MGITLTVSTKTDIEMKLRSWHDLEKRRQFLERKIPELEERLQRLASKLSKDGILSSIIQQTENMDMPRGSDVTDRVGNAVASAVDRVNELKTMIRELGLERDIVETQLWFLESSVEQLSDRHRKILTMYYRDHCNRHQICTAVYASERRMYEMLAESVDLMGRWIV